MSSYLRESFTSADIHGLLYQWAQFVVGNSELFTHLLLGRRLAIRQIRLGYPDLSRALG